MRAFNDRFTPRKKFGLTIPVLMIGMLGFFFLIFGVVALGTPNKGILSLFIFGIAISMFVFSYILHSNSKLARIKVIMFSGNIDRNKKPMVLK